MTENEKNETEEKLILELTAKIVDNITANPIDIKTTDLTVEEVKEILRNEKVRYLNFSVSELVRDIYSCFKNLSENNNTENSENETKSKFPETINIAKTEKIKEE